MAKQVPELLKLLQGASQTYAEEPAMVFRFMHDVGPVRLQAEGARSSQRVKPKHNRTKSESTSTAQTGTLTVSGRVITKEQVIRVKQALDTLKAGEEATNEMIAKEMTALAQRYKPDALQRVTLEEVLVRTYRALKRRDLMVLKQWVSEWEQTQQPEKPKQQASLQTAAQYQQLFELYDTNQNGELTLDELKSGLNHLFSFRDIEEMFQRYDANHDQRISLQEFLHLMAPDS